MSRRLGLLLSGAVLILGLAPTAGAGQALSIPDARDRAAAFAKRTCEHDESCAGFCMDACR